MPGSSDLHPPNAFTVDLEDWYHGIEIPSERWASFTSRIEKGLLPLLDLLEKHQTRATFFTLGWIAEKFPEIVKRVAAGGHELGSHGFSHEKVYHLNPAQFREEVRRTRMLLQDLSGQEVAAHRSPFFTVTPETLWALDILADEGYKIDCSISPVRTWRYGISSSPEEIYFISDKNIIEFPVSSFPLIGRKWAIGGAYFRILPYYFSKRAFKKRQKQGRNTMFYIHPWEYDPEHPVTAMEWKAKLTHYTGLKNTLPNTGRLLKDFRFDTVSAVVGHYASSGKPLSITSQLLRN